MDFEFLLDEQFLNNSTKQYLIALGIFLGLLVIFQIFRSLVVAKLRKLAEATPTGFDDELVRVLERIYPIFYFYLALYLGLKTLTLNEKFSNIIHVIFVFVIVIQGIISFGDFIIYVFRKVIYQAAGHTVDENQTVFYGVKLITRIVIWVTGLLLLLSNLGINVSSLAASLGIGGIAVALAVQNILGDIFSSFSIYFDKPFEIGDTIMVGTDMGVVKKIGIKSTRLTTLQGEELVISNKELTTTRIQNFKKMQKRRVLFSVGVTYDTSTEKLKKVSEMIKQIFQIVKEAELDRVNFKGFGAFSLDFEIVYYHLSADFNEYMNTREVINLHIKDAFAKEGIEMAFPTQTLYVSQIAS